MYLHVHVDTHTHMNRHIYLFAKHVHTRTRIYTQARIQAYIHTRTHARIHVDTHIYNTHKCTQTHMHHLLPVTHVGAGTLKLPVSRHTVELHPTNTYP